MIGIELLFGAASAQYGRGRHTARPDEIRFAEALPKTRSGKIMRRLLRDLARGTHGSQDTSTLEDQKVMDRLRMTAPEEE